MSALTAEQFEHWGLELRLSNEQAFSELFHKTYNPMLRYASRIISDEEAARDVLQDVYIKLWHKRFELDTDKSLKALLYRMVRNKCYNHLRDNSRVSLGVDESQPDPMPLNEETETEDHDKLKTRLNQWIEELPVRQREAFELSRFEGLDHEEIADVMECSPRTVNNHIVSALNHLRNRHNQYSNSSS